MATYAKWAASIGSLSLFLLLLSGALTWRSGVQAQTRKPVMMTHLFTGPDGQTHAEEVEAKFTQSEVYKMMQTTGLAELHRAAPGNVIDWHPAPRRQYVITLSGRGEIELVSGKKIPMSPGHIDFAEDTTGKGHITRVIGNEDRITLQLPVPDQAGR